MEYLLELVVFMSYNEAMFHASLEQGLISGLMKTILNLAHSIEEMRNPEADS